MNDVTTIISAAFPFFKVSTAVRPGGGLLLTMKGEDGTKIIRAIPFDGYQTAEKVQWVVAAIKRDLALKAGVTPKEEHLHYRTREPLPTYLSCVSAATTQRRPLLKAKASTRAAAQVR